MLKVFAICVVAHFKPANKRLEHPQTDSWCHVYLISCYNYHFEVFCATHMRIVKWLSHASFISQTRTSLVGLDLVSGETKSVVRHFQSTVCVAFSKCRTAVEKWAVSPSCISHIKKWRHKEQLVLTALFRGQYFTQLRAEYHPMLQRIAE